MRQNKGSYNYVYGVSVNKCKIIIYIVIVYLMITSSLSFGVMKPSPNYIILLAHGIGADEDTFIKSYGDFKGYLKSKLKLVDNKSSANVKEGYIYIDHFDDPKGSSIDNAHSIGDRNIGYSWTKKAADEYKNKYDGEAPPTKHIIIAHSMGGLASRYYITHDFYNNDIKKLITLDTPHLGADGVAWYEKWEKGTGLSRSIASACIDSALQTLWATVPYWMQSNGEDVYISSAHLTMMNLPIISATNFYMPGFSNVKLSGAEEYLGSFGFWLFILSKYDGEGLKEMSPYSDFINELKEAEPSQKTGLYEKLDPIEYRLVSARGMPTPHKKLIESNYDCTPFTAGLMLKWMPEYNSLPSEGAKAYSALLSIAAPGSWAVKDGSLLVGVDSSRGEGVKIFDKGDTKRYGYLFKYDALDNSANNAKAIDTVIKEILLVQEVLQVPMPVIYGMAFSLKWLPVVMLTAVELENMGEVLYSNVGDNKTNSFTYVSNHGWIIDKSTENDRAGNSIIEYSLYDEPQISFSGIQTSIDTSEYNATQNIVHTSNIQEVRIENLSEANNNPPYYAERSVPFNTTATTEGYLSYVLVKVPSTQISGVMNDFKPLFMKSFQISENFGAWQDFKPSALASQIDADHKVEYIEADAGKFHLHMDNWGNYVISGLNLAEGQNVIAFKLTNKVGQTSNQIIKIIQNSIPMLASKFTPPSNYFTPDPLQTIAVEFHKSGYTADSTEAVAITSFEVDGIPISADKFSNDILKVVTYQGTYEMWTKAQYSPAQPLSDGEHNIAVVAKANIGVSQAMWNFFVDTQAPTISIEALNPYSPSLPSEVLTKEGAPSDNTLEANDAFTLRYNTSDNLSSILRTVSIKLYDPSGNYITTISTADTQAVGDNYITVDREQLMVNGKPVADGNYSIKIKAYDIAGNSTTESVSLSIDSTPPAVTDANVDPAPVTMSSTSMNLNMSVSEPSLVTIKMTNKDTGVASAYIAQAQKNTEGISSGQAQGETAAAASYSWSFNDQFGVSGPEDGVYKFEITAQDAAGNVSVPYTVDNIRIDRTPPVIFANACLPYVLSNKGAAPYTTTLHYQVSESNDKAGNRSKTGDIDVGIEVYNENTDELIKVYDNAQVPTGTDNTVDFDGTSASGYGILPKGAYKFKITSTDKYGNSSVAYSTCVKDGISPVISFPANNDKISGSVSIRGIAPDPDWTNNLPFKDYRVYYAKGDLPVPTNLDIIADTWKTDFIEVPQVNRDMGQGAGGKNISIRPLQGDSTLAYLYTNGLENGTYTLLLIVEEDGGEKAACVRKINVDNGLTAAVNVGPVVSINELPAKVHFENDKDITLPISVSNSAKNANISIQVVGNMNGNESIVYYKDLKNVAANIYTGKPQYQPGQSLGYYIWQDTSGWHIRWSSNGSDHHFTGNLMAAGTITDVNMIGSGIKQVAGLISWDTNMSGGEGGIDLNTTAAIIIITPKIDENPDNPQITADNIYLGMTKAAQSYLPIMINNDLTLADTTVKWNGKFETGAYVDSGIYKIRAVAEGVDGIGLSTDEAQIEVETDFDLTNVEGTNLSFDPFGMPNSTTVRFNLTKDSYITAYVYKEGVPDPVCTITREALYKGAPDPAHKISISWKGNYPTPDSNQMYTTGNFRIKVIATSADGKTQKDSEIRGIIITGSKPDPNQASLDPIGGEISFNGETVRSASGESDYYFEAKGTGRLYPPRKFSYDLVPYGKQIATVYPYVPYAMLVHRGFKQVDTYIDVHIVGQYDDTWWETGWASGGEANQDTFNFNKRVVDTNWGFRDKESGIDTDKSKFSFSGGGRAQNMFRGYKGNSEMSFNWANIEVYFYTQRGGDKRFLLDKLSFPMAHAAGEIKSEKGMFKMNVSENHINDDNYKIVANVSLFDFVKYSRLTNRFMPWFGFVNKNLVSARDYTTAEAFIDQLGFPGGRFFNDPLAKINTAYGNKVVNRTGLNLNDLNILSNEKNILNYDPNKGTKYKISDTSQGGIIIVPNSGVSELHILPSGSIKPLISDTDGFNFYLSDETTTEFIQITAPEGGSFVITGKSGRVGTDLVYSYLSNLKNPFLFNYPASKDEVSAFKDVNKKRYDYYIRNPGSWTGINESSPYELDGNTVALSVEVKALNGEEIRYRKNKNGYFYESQTLGTLYSKEFPKNVIDKRFNFVNISDPSIVLSLAGSKEATLNAYLTGTLNGAVGQMWTTDDDVLLGQSGGKITSPLMTFNKDGFGSGNETLKISEPYVSSIIGGQDLASPNAVKYTFWKYDHYATSEPELTPIDNPQLLYEDWEISVKDLSGKINEDIVLEKIITSPIHLNDVFEARLKLDSSENRYVKVTGKANGPYTLMFKDGDEWKVINDANSPADGVLGWWNVSRLNGRYTVLLKLKDASIVSAQDVLVGTVVRPSSPARVTSAYKRAEVLFTQGVFNSDQLVTVTPLKADRLHAANRPVVPTIGPIVELKPSPYIFTNTGTSEDFRPFLVFRYTKSDLHEMNPTINTNDPDAVKGLNLNIHQITSNGDIQVVSGNKQSYDNGFYVFEATLDHFSEYALIKGRYNMKAPLVLTDRSIVNFTPITVYGTAPAESRLDVYVNTSPEVEFEKAKPVSGIELGSTESGIASYKFNKVGLIKEGINYIFVTSSQQDARTVSSIVVTYDITPPSLEGGADLVAFSPNGDNKYDLVTYKMRSSEKGKMYLIIKDPKGDTMTNLEISSEAGEEIKMSWTGDELPDGDYSYVIFAVDEAGNISGNISGHTIIDRVAPKISGVTASPNPFTPNDDGVNDTTTISFEVNEPCYTTIKIFRGDALFYGHGFSNLQPLTPMSYSWDGRGEHNELIGGTYTYYLEAEDSVGNISTSETKTILVDREPFLLQYAYCDPYYFAPKNPKNNKTNVKYSLSRDDVKVTVQIFDGTGKVIATPLDEQVEKSGEHQVSWNGEGAIDGTYGFRVKALSVLGDASGEVTGNLVIDNVPPTVIIKSCDLGDELCKLVYSIPEEAKVTVSIVDESGAVIDTIVTGEMQAPGEHEAIWMFGSRGVQSQASVYSFKVSAEDKALNTDEKQSSSFSLPGPLEITDVSAAPAIFNPNSEVINKYTNVKYKLSAKAGQAQVTVKILSDAGATVKRLTDGEYQAPGAYSMIWYGDDLTGKTVTEGNYKFDISAVDSLGNKAGQQVPVVVASNSSSIISVSPEVFSPNGDGIADTTLFTYTVDYYWQLTGEANTELDVLDQNGNIVYMFAGHHTKGIYTTVWDGSKQTMNEQGIVTSFGTVSDGTYYARIKMTDPAGSIIYSNTVPIKADIKSGSALPETGFINNNGFTPNGDGQKDTCAFSYYLDEPSDVTVKVHAFSATASYDATNLVKTLVDNVMTSAGTQDVIWDGSTDGPGDTDSNGFVNKGKYVFVLESTDQYGNISPKQGATVWVQDVPLNINAPVLVENPTPKVFTSVGGNTSFAFTLSQSLEGETQEPEKFTISGMKIMAAGIYDMGRVTVKVYDHAGGLAATLMSDQVCDNDGTKTVSWDGSGAAEGKYTVIVSAEDLAGAKAVQSISGVAYLDKTTPVISGISINRNYMSPGTNTETVNYTVSDNLSSITSDIPNKISIVLKVYKGGSLIKTITSAPTLDSGSTGSADWDGTLNSGGFAGTSFGSGFTDGQYDLKVIACDAAGNATEETRTFTVDSIKPSINAVTSYPNPFSPNGVKPQTNITAEVTDTNSPTWEMRIESGSNWIRQYGTSSAINYNWNGRDSLGNNIGDGNYNCSIIAYDLAGNTNEVSQVIHIDDTKPVITASVTPEILSGEKGQVAVLSLHITDANAKLRWSVQISSESDTSSSETNNVNDTYSWYPPHDASASGAYSFVIVATDEAGNTALTIESLTVDNIAPSITFESPAEGSWNKNIVYVTGNITDAHPGRWTLFNDGGFISSGTGNVNHASVGTFSAPLVDGEYQLMLVATDDAGNDTDVIVRKINIDITPPTINSMTSETFKDGLRTDTFNPYIDQAIVFVGSVTDNSFNSSLYPNQSVAHPITYKGEIWTGASFVCSIEGVSWEGKNANGDYVNEGDYTAKIKVVDAAGNISPSYYDYTIKVKDDQQMTSNLNSSYSHDPDLTLSGIALSLRFITGESWGSRYLESKVHCPSDMGDHKTDVNYFTISTQQNVIVSNSHTGNSTYWDEIDRSNDEVMMVYEGCGQVGRHNITGPTEPFPAGRYRVSAYGQDSMDCGVTPKTGVTYNEPQYNKTYNCSVSNLQLWDLQPESSLKTFEASASYMSGTREHCVWSAIKYSSGVDWSSMFNGSEIIYNQILDGVWRKTNEGSYSLHNYTYPKEIRLTSTGGDSINPAVACDSTGDKVYVVWEDHRSPYFNGAIFMMISTNEGNSWPPDSPELQPIIASSDACSLPSVAVDQGSSVKYIYVAFVKQVNGHKELWVKKGTISGNTVAWNVNPVRITRYEFTTCEASKPSIVCDTSGNAYVAWEDTRTGTSEIFFQKIPVNFAPFSGSGMTTMSMPSAPVIVGGPMVIMSGSITPELISPINGATVKNLRPTFKWYGVQNIKDYRIECASTSDADALSSSLDNYTTTISDVSSAQPICEFTQNEHFMGLDENNPGDPYWYWRVQTITTEATTSEVGSFKIELTSSVSGVTNWPNPFDPNKERTKIRYRLGREPNSVTIKIYDITGALVRELDGTTNPEGGSVGNKYNDVEWDGRNGRGDIVLNGVYPFEVTVSYGDKSVTGRGKAVVLK
jgi:flagellar hook assembly protein FlgD